MWRRWVCVALVGALVVTAACSASSDPDDARPDPTSGSGATARPDLTVGPATGLADVPIEVTVGGVGRATVVVTATDDADRAWRGEVAVEGSAEVLLSVLEPEDGGDALFKWSFDAIAVTLAIAVPGGDDVTAEVERRILAPGLRPVLTDPEVDGFVGSYWAPTEPRDESSAVVFLGGSLGGYGGLFEAPLLASRQVHALQVAVAGVPGTPDELADIPLETVETAVRWLADRPGVDPDRIWLLGASRGSEAALLVAAAHPELIAGVVAAAPSNVVLCRPGCGGAAWTRDGVPVPYTRMFDEPDPTDVPEAVIPVERIDGPVITTCGGVDETWEACAYAEAITARRGDRSGDLAAEASGAGHGVADMAAGSVVDPTLSPEERAADEEVRIEAWSALLAALDAA